MATNKKKPVKNKLGDIKPIYNTSAVIKSVADRIGPLLRGKKADDPKKKKKK